MEVFSNIQYKKLFLPNLSEKILNNNAVIQLYNLEEFLKDIIMPVAPYRTKFNFILFVTQGCIKQHLENEIIEVRQRGFLFIKQGAITATVELSDDIQGYFLAYESSVLSEQDLPIHKASIFYMTPHQVTDHLSFDIFLKLLLVLQQELWLNNMEVNDVCITVLHAVLIKMLSTDPNEQYKANTRPLEISLQFRDLLFKFHIDQKHVLFYAEKLAVTENYLNKCVKQVTQKTPKQWINEVDINYAKSLLHSCKSISEVAFELNFQTASHFTQLFKKVTGMTPREYKRKIEISTMA